MWQRFMFWWTCAGCKEKQPPKAKGVEVKTEAGMERYCFYCCQQQ